MRIQKFKCRACDGAGRLHGPWRICVQCGGEGKITRTVDETIERVGRGRALSSRRGLSGFEFNRAAIRESEAFEDEWREISEALDRDGARRRA